MRPSPLAPGDVPSAALGGIAGLSVRRPYLAAVLNLLVMLAGLAALLGLEVRELPDVERPVVTVRGDYPGAAPQTVDAQVTARVEAAVARVPGVRTLTSASEEGNFRIRASFDPGRDLTAAAGEVREAVARVERRLPPEVERLTVIKSDPDARPAIQIAVTSRSAGLEALSERVEDSVVPALTAIDGVAEVAVFGARGRALRVAVSPDRLAAHGLGIDEVAEVLRAARFDVPAGRLEAGAFRLPVRADASTVDPRAIAGMRLGPGLTLGEVADVHLGPETVDSLGRLDGRLAVVLGVVRQAGANTVAISGAVARTLERLAAETPDLAFSVVEDEAVFIEAAVAEVARTIVLATLVVVGVVWLFVGRLAATLVPAVAIPVALSGVLAAIWLAGFSLNLVTLLALVLATGVVVDDAIVVVENIQRRRAEGLGARAAAVLGTREVFFAVIATTATLAAVFLPISFLPGPAGGVFAEFGWVLAITVALSSFTALTLCPALAARLDDDPATAGPTRARPPAQAHGRGLAGLYDTGLRAAMAAPLATVTLALVLGAAAVPLFGTLGEELVPPEDRGSLSIYIVGPEAAGLAYTDRQVAAVEAVLSPLRAGEVAVAMSSVTGFYDPDRGRVILRLAPWRSRETTQAEIETDLRARLDDIPGAAAYIGGGNSLDLRDAGRGRLRFAVTGPTHAGAGAEAERLVAMLEGLEGVRRASVSHSATLPQLSVEIDRARAADLDVSLDALAGVLRSLVQERRVAEIAAGDRQVPVLLQPAAGSVRTPEDLLSLAVRSRSGALVPLWQLVRLEETATTAELRRHGQRRAVEIDLRVEAGADPARVGARVAATAREGLGAGHGLVAIGEAAMLAEAGQTRNLTFLIALAVVLLVLVAQFESVTSALVVMLTVPMGLAAAVLALWLTGTSLNVYSQVGALMLIGIMAKNAILLVEFADQRRDGGLDAWTAALEAARVRLRPIAMTLASTVLAGLPLILSEGPGAEGRQAIGWVVFGGLGLATLATLFLTPAAYALIAPLGRPRAAETERLLDELRAVPRPGSSQEEGLSLDGSHPRPAGLPDTGQQGEGGADAAQPETQPAPPRPRHLRRRRLSRVPRQPLG